MASSYYISFCGEIRSYAFDFAPYDDCDFAVCNGASVSRQQYQMLFSICGGAFGYDSNAQTFALPNLCGRVPMGANSPAKAVDETPDIGAPYLGDEQADGAASGFAVGAATGAITAALSAAEGLPLHSHNLPVLVSAFPYATLSAAPSSSLALARPTYVNDASNLYGVAPAFVPETSGSRIANTKIIGPAGGYGSGGGAEPHPNMQPFLVLNFCIALKGDFPS